MLRMVHPVRAVRWTEPAGEDADMASRRVIDAVEKLLQAQGSFRTRDLCRATRLVRQGAQRQVAQLIREGRVTATGEARARLYRRAPEAAARFQFPMPGTDAARAWTTLARQHPAVGALPPAAREVAEYVLRELVDNAATYSGGKNLWVEVRPGDPFELAVEDDGVGLFERLRREVGCASRVEAAQEVGKPRLGACTGEHAGEGLFFVLRTADLVELDSGGLRLVRDRLRDDHALMQAPDRLGTRVRFAVARGRRVTLAAEVATWTTRFRITRGSVRVKLMEYGTHFVSRAEARRMLAGMDHLSDLTLDFAQVEGVGAAFADELLRVWAPAHPQVRLETVGANELVADTLRRTRMKDEG